MTRSALRASCRSHAQLHGPNLAAPVMQTVTASIANTATERDLGFSPELRTSVSRCDVTRDIPRYGTTPRGKRK